MAAAVTGGRWGALGLRIAPLVAFACVCAALPPGEGAAARAALVHRSIVLGHSVDGRPIVAFEVGDPQSPNKALVVGCIHGTECAGIAVADRLASLMPRSDLDLWVVPDLNPDGAAAGQRGNARGVDLNRNFPWRWKPLTGVFYSGPRPLSEPESRLIDRLILRVRPRVSIWFHQHLDVVDESGGELSVERQFAREAGMKLKRLAREHGSVVGWENEVLPGSTAFVVELPAGAVGPVFANRLVRATLLVAGASGQAEPIRTLIARRLDLRPSPIQAFREATR